MQTVSCFQVKHVAVDLQCAGHCKARIEYRAKPICFFSHLFFLPAILFFSQYFAHNLAIFQDNHKLFFSGISPALIHDCCIRVIMVTALLGYILIFQLPVFLRACIMLIKSCLWVFYWSLSTFARLKRLSYSSQTTKISPKFNLFFQILFFALNLLFFQKFCQQIPNLKAILHNILIEYYRYWKSE